MMTQIDRDFGAIITRLIQKDNLSRLEAKNAFDRILRNQTTEMQQGAFLAALSAKGETVDEVTGAWETIYELDTEKVDLKGLEILVENSGTGMDTFKTFNISTAASIIAAADGVPMARHGARAITSVCGTVDMAEAIGVDVECSADMVAESIQKTGIGLFNGMSPQIHPKALGRILSNISFGSTLNIAASLANPALPNRAVRGVFAREMIRPVIQVMKAIGYKRAIVLWGGIDGSDKGMDEASVCGKTYCAELKSNGEIIEYDFQPSDFKLGIHDPEHLKPEPDINREAKAFVALMNGKIDGAKSEAAFLNAGLIHYVAGKSKSIEDGIQTSAAILSDGKAFKKLEDWVAAQNRDPAGGLEKLNRLM